MVEIGGGHTTEIDQVGGRAASELEFLHVRGVDDAQRVVELSVDHDPHIAVHDVDNNVLRLVGPDQQQAVVVVEMGRVVLVDTKVDTLGGLAIRQCHPVRPGDFLVAEHREAVVAAIGQHDVVGAVAVQVGDCQREGQQVGEVAHAVTSGRGKQAGAVVEHDRDVCRGGIGHGDIDIAVVVHVGRGDGHRTVARGQGQLGLETGSSPVEQHGDIV